MSQDVPGNDDDRPTDPPSDYAQDAQISIKRVMVRSWMCFPSASADDPCINAYFIPASLSCR